ncbi:MAG: hypothetical protein M3O65_09770, partial [Actinomycetota bacterium]|nr:hypothetical protein [Actinomycetota bacterium]
MPDSPAAPAPPVLAVVGVAAPLGQQVALLGRAQPRQLPEPGIAGHVEEHGAVDHVGVGALHQLAGQLDHGRDLLGGLGEEAGAGHVQGVHVLEVGGRLAPPQLQVVLAVPGRPPEHVVVHVGDVLAVGDLVAAAAQEPGQGV